MFPVYNTTERETFAFAESMTVLRTASIGLLTKTLARLCTFFEKEPGMKTP
jgi:hypothetical protein